MTARGAARRVMPTAVVGAVLVLLAGCGGAEDPAPLSLASQTRGGAVAAAEGGPIGRDGAIVVAVPLREGPDAGRTWTADPAAVTTERVTALARALQVDGPVEELPGGWRAGPARSSGTVGDGGAATPSLIVLKDGLGTWFYDSATSCDLTQPTDGGNCSTSAVAPPPTSTAAPTPVPAVCDGRTGPALDPARQRTEQEPLLRAAGIDRTASVASEAQDGTGGVVLVASPAVGALPTDGLQTRIALASCAQGPVPAEGNGLLAVWRQGAQYALVQAETAIDRLRTQPRPALGAPLLCRQAPGDEGCLGSEAVVVAAGPGLMRDTDLSTGRPILVPAWLFSIRERLLLPNGTPLPADQQPTTADVVAITALADAALATPDPGAPEPDASVEPPVGGGGGGSVPGAPGTAEPGAADPGSSGTG